jgi:hypothetical protein
VRERIETTEMKRKRTKIKKLGENKNWNEVKKRLSFRRG